MKGFVGVLSSNLDHNLDELIIELHLQFSSGGFVSELEGGMSSGEHDSLVYARKDRTQDVF